MVNLSRRALFWGDLRRKHDVTVTVKEAVLRTVARPPTAIDEDIFKRICN